MKRLILLTMLLLISGVSYAADEWLKTRPQSTDQKIDWPTANQANNAALDRLVGNYREGMALTYSSTTTIAVASGEVVCSNSGGTVRKFRQNTSSTNVTFADIDTGVEASGTTYYIFANCDADATTATFKISASSTSPSGITYYKRLGSFYNNAASDITGITNDNDLSQLGSPTSKTVNVVYQAATNGYVTISCSYTTPYSYSTCGCYSDTVSTPTTLLNFAAANFNGFYVSNQAVSCHIRKGDYWKATVTGTGSLATVYFTPIGN